MSDIIHLLPDSVANQIAAGEVIQRPASVVKELIENSIDAGATNVQLIIKDGGNSLIQIIDNGKGMSETDARMAFERHATSKIKDSSDLFTLHTFGFRGEALASIAAVAQVELRTKTDNNELGTFIEIAGTRVFKQESVTCAKGTNIAVKNLFFNVPARRRFLKSPSTEMMHVRNEFYRIVLVHPEVSFSFIENDVEIFNLPATNLKLRIDNVFNNISKRRLEQQLLPIQADTSLLSISGFVTRPEFAQKTANQYFFVNGRYMRHPYFHKAVMMAYSQLIKPDENPNYFIYFEVDTHTIDINVHPSKTEIKFENEKAIWSILMASIKESLGKFQVAPTLDFDNEGMPDIPVVGRDTIIQLPQTNFNPDYNPFNSSNSSKKTDRNWEELYNDFSSHTSSHGGITPFSEFSEVETEIGKQQMMAFENTGVFYVQYGLKYIFSGVKTGLMMIDQHRAHFRILYDQFMLKLRAQKSTSQQLLFPEILELSKEQMNVMEQIKEDLQWVGFDLELFGPNSYAINGVPSEIDNISSVAVINELIADVMETELSVQEVVQERVGRFLARKGAIKSGQTLTSDEMVELVNNLFSCENHQYTPDGKKIIVMLNNDDIERFFR